MPRYLVQANYTQQGVAGLVSSPEDRTEVLKGMVETAGGEVVTLDYCFGEFDVVTILDLPDHVTMTSLSLAFGSAGSITNLRTTVLIPVTDVAAAAQKAKEITYRPPGA